MSDVMPGQWIKVTVKSEPRSDGGRKTLMRLFQQDPAVRKERQRLARARTVRTKRRGGRIWIIRPSRVAVAKTTPGASYRLFASVETLTALRRLARYVDIAPA